MLFSFILLVLVAFTCISLFFYNCGYHFFAHTKEVPSLHFAYFVILFLRVMEVSVLVIKTAHPSRSSGRKGIAKCHETLKKSKRVRLCGRTYRCDLSLKFGDFFLQTHHSLRYFQIPCKDRKYFR